MSLFKFFVKINKEGSGYIKRVTLVRVWGFINNVKPLFCAKLLINELVKSGFTFLTVYPLKVSRDFSRCRVLCVVIGSLLSPLLVGS